MSRLFNLRTSFVVAALLGLATAQAAEMTKSDYNRSKSRIAADFRAGKEACASMAGNAKDVCLEQAKGKEKVTSAELEYAYSGKAADRNKLLMAKAKAAYAIAVERCDDKAGNDKDVCVKEAKAGRTRAMADARMGKQIGEAKSEAAVDKRDADYKVAAEKCESLAGNARNNCIASAKARFGRS